jgi:membrane protein DedA with SNARE-associated domain
MEEILTRYGLLALLILAAVEGDATLILAGVISHLGIFNLLPAICVGTVGAFGGDCAWYWVGRSRSTFIRRSRLYRRVGGRAEQLARRFGVWGIIAARFVFGTRIATALFWGIQQMPFARFAALDLIGCVLWAVVFSGLGYFLSGSAAALIGEVRRIEIWLLVALAALALFSLLSRYLLRRMGGEIIRNVS